MNNSLSSVTGNEIRFPAKVESGRISQAKAPAASEEALPKDGVTLTGGQQTAPETPKMVKVSVFPQDPFMDKPVTEEIEQSKIGKNLSGPRVKADDKTPVAIADPEGNFFFEPLKPEFDQASSFVCVYKTLDMHQKNLGHEVKWAFGSNQLDVVAHAGEDKNAYYARWQQSVNFFHFKSPELDKTVQTSQSVDIVSHETGHATLDGMKPKYLGSWTGETMAFHEAFADATAVLYTLSSDHNVSKVVEETGGDLRKNSRASMLAEEFGKAIKLGNSDPNDDNNTWLRNARNDFKYIPMSELPSYATKKEELSAEVHSYSRIFTGGFYDCVINLYDRFAKELPSLPQPGTPDGQEPKPAQPDYESALKKARDVIGPLLAKGAELSPASGTDYRKVALGMIKADEMTNGGAYKNELTKAFLDRHIIDPEDLEPKREMPEVKLEKPLADKESALEFLKQNAEKMGVDASAYTEANIIKNNRGETIVEFESTVEVPLKQHGLYQVAGADDVYADVYGGLTLAFDADGKLVSQTEDPITPEKISSVVAQINNAKDEDLIRMTPIYKGDNLFKSKNVPYTGEVYQEPSGKMKVRRIPIAVD